MTCVSNSIFFFFCQIEFVFQPIFVEIPIAAVGIVVAGVEFVAVVKVSTSPKFETGYQYLYPREEKKFNQNQKAFLFFFVFFSFQYEERKKKQELKFRLFARINKNTHVNKEVFPSDKKRRETFLHHDCSIE